MTFSRRDTLKLLAGAAVAGVVLPALPARAAATELRIGWQKGGVFALAKAEGALEARLAPLGFTVSWNEFTSGPPLLEALGANALDFGSTGDIPPLFAQAAGGDLLYVAATRARSMDRPSSSSRTRRSRALPTSRARRSPSSAAPARTTLP